MADSASASGSSSGSSPFGSFPPRTLALIGAGVVALIAAIVLGAVLLMGGGDEETGLPGLVIVDGERLPAPYSVGVTGTQVTVNGRVALDTAPRTTEEHDPAQAADNDAFDMVEQARHAAVANGGADEAAAVALLQAHPAAPAVEVLDEPRRIEVTDGGGLTVSLQLEMLEYTVRNPQQADFEAEAQSIAELWAAHLEEGGGIIASTSGAVMLVPGTGLDDFVAELDAAQALSGAARDEALRGLLGVPTLIEEAGGDAGDPVDLFASVLRDGEGGTRLIALTDGEARATGGGADQGVVGGGKTPSKPIAHVMGFSVLGLADGEPFIRALKDEGYTVISLTDPVDARSFGLTSQTGALYNITHSSAQGLSVALLPSVEAARRYAQALQEARVPNTAYRFWKDEGGRIWFDLTPATISQVWKSDDTIVHSASCYSGVLSGSFNAREFFGYSDKTSCPIALPDTQKLWQRWSGVDGDGEYRSANRAMAQGGFSNIFLHVDGSPGGDTVLSPSVVYVAVGEQQVRNNTSASVTVGVPTLVEIGFDAEMDTSIGGALAVSISGCLTRTAVPIWNFSSLLTFPVSADTPGDFEIRVNPTFTYSTGGIQLDGNTQPPPRPSVEGATVITLPGFEAIGPSGVAPNRDVHLIRGFCMAPGTGSSGTGIPTPTATTAGGTGGAPDSSTPTPTATEETVVMTVLVIRGDRYPAEQFITAQPDNCEELHYHQARWPGPVRALNGVLIEETQGMRNGCGHGMLKDIPSETASFPKSQVDAWQEWWTGR